MNVLIIGASGLVGSYLWKSCQARNWQTTGTYHNYALPDLVPLKLTESAQVDSLIAAVNPEVIFLPAFCSNVDYCQQNPAETYQINVLGSANVIQACRARGSKLVFYSSDYVFNGKSGPYQETDTPDPICVYGQQKLEVEQKITAELDDYLILRVTVVYGWEAQGKNFVSRLIRTLQNGQSLKVPQDQVGSPTLVNDIAEASCTLVEAGAKGIFHVAGSDLVDRYRFAQMIAQSFGLPTQQIIPVTTMDLGQPAPRPLSAGMSSRLLEKTIGWQPRGVISGMEFLKSTMISEHPQSPK